MNFLEPGAFLFAASLPVVVLFYLLKRKRVAHLVPSTLLWQRFLSETQANAPFQRLRHNWLLLLQLLLLILTILALARPYFASKHKGGRTIVAILDASASMQAIDETPNRFEKARKLALQVVDGMAADDQMVVLQAGAVTEVKQSSTADKSALRRAINSASVTDSPTRLNEALKLAETLVQNKTKDSEVHLFSDGASGSLAELQNKQIPLVYHRIGIRNSNMGIVNLDVRANPENPAQRAIFATVLNSSTNIQQNQIELLFDDKVLEVKSLSLKPKESVPEVFIAPQEKDGVFTVRLTAKDDLDVDNKASVVSLLPQPIKVLLVTAGNKFLEKAIRAHVNAQLTKVDQLTDEAKEYDLVILDNVAPLTWPAVNTLAFHTVRTNLFEGWRKVEAPVIVDWKGNHPLLRFVNFDNVQIAETLGVKTPRWAMPLVESSDTPLILAGEQGRQRIVWVGFDILQSTWPLRIAFPIFVANAIDWLNPASERAAQLTVKAGEPFRLTYSDKLEAPEVTMPDGAKRKLMVDPRQRELVFGDTYKQGVYKLRSGTNTMAFCVNLLDSQETDITPREEIQMGKFTKVGASSYKQASLEIWRWLALAALLMLGFEWWYYHRRTA